MFYEDKKLKIIKNKCYSVSTIEIQERVQSKTN